MNKKIKAVGLFSGGLDSLLAAKVIADQGVEVYCLHCVMPWSRLETERQRARVSALGCYFEQLNLGEDYLEMIRDPQHGYGSAFNPCIDCHRFMVIKAGEFMQKIGAQFVFTGEVLGQRPMSQRRACLPLIEKETECEGFLVRPLSAKLLDVTLPEEKGWIDRQALFDFSGRSRKPQIALAEKFGITDYAQPAGGCLLTEKHFAQRLKDFFDFGCTKAQEIKILPLGRYLRIDQEHIAVIGRDEEENNMLEMSAVDGDMILFMANIPGPVLVLRGKAMTEDVCRKAAGIVQWHSKARGAQPESVRWQVVGKNISGEIEAESLTEHIIDLIKR